jgi:hypothetical protein
LGLYAGDGEGRGTVIIGVGDVIRIFPAASDRVAVEVTSSVGRRLPLAINAEAGLVVAILVPRNKLLP